MTSEQKRRKRQRPNAKVAKHGPKIHLPGGDKIPLSKSTNNSQGESMRKLPAAWKVETVPQVMRFPKYANYYRDSFTSALIRRASFQFMFGGLLRSIFGIYSNQRYWNPALEKELIEHMRDEYLESKAARLYGIYAFEVTKDATVLGKMWSRGQKPKLNRGRVSKWWLRKGGVIYVRMNRLNGLERKQPSNGHVDVEFQPISITGHRKKMGVSVLSMPWKGFEWLLKDNRLRRLQDDGRIFKIRSRGKTPPELEGGAAKVPGVREGAAESVQEK